MSPVLIQRICRLVKTLKNFHTLRVSTETGPFSKGPFFIHHHRYEKTRYRKSHIKLACMYVKCIVDLCRTKATISPVKPLLNNPY